MKSVIFCFVLAVAASTPCWAQPKLSVDNMTVDLGTLYNGTTKTGTITLKNIGNQPLKILRVTPSCGCTTVRQPKSELPPNDSDAVEVSFNATLYHGPVEKYVNIETNDPLSQYVAIKLIADVKEELSPVSGSYAVWLGSTRVGAKSEQRLSFVNRTNQTIHVRSVTSSAPNVTATPETSKVAPADTLTVLLSAIPDKTGYSTGQVTILTDGKHQPTVELKYYYIGENKQ
ncbi:MAG TPA: DUF1573 domain-containing protein [Bacteroidota bacterium]|nr:DUF1573 domain-containing protein [Bacteroidota bacterium]